MGLLDLLSGALREPAECVIEVDGREISDLYPFLTEVSVETSRADAATASLRFETRRDERGRWSVQDAGVLEPWAAIRLKAAFGHRNEEIMRGYIRQVNADYPQEAGATTVSVTCQDSSLALDREHVRRSWGEDTPASDAQILQETVVGRAGLSLDPDNGSGQSGLVLLQDSTDIRFLRSRAEVNGYELIFHEGRVYFGPLRLDAEAQATIRVYAGPDTHCFSFSVDDDGHQPDAVAFDVAAEDGSTTTHREVQPDLPALGPTAAGSQGSGLAPFTWRMRRRGGSERELAAQAQRLANEQSLRVSAEGELDGSLYGHVLRVAEPVAVDGVGERYGGTYYVDSVTHTFNTEGYRQRFRLLRNAYGDDLSLSGNPLAGLL